MSKVYVRVDDRLIHGQTIVAWCPTLGIKEIVAIDDVSARNATLKSIMTMGVPSQYKTNIVTIEDAKTILNSDTTENRIMIVKFPEVLEQIKDEIKNCEQIVLGNIKKRDDTNHNITKATGIFYLSDNDIRILDQFADEGIDIVFQQLPSASPITWDSFKKSI